MMMTLLLKEIPWHEAPPKKIHIVENDLSFT